MGIETKKEVFNLLFSSYKNANDVSAETISAYMLLLADIPFVQLKTGVIKCIATCKYLPSIAEIREAAREVIAEVTDSRLKTYAEAWAEVENNVKTVGYYGKPAWSTPEIEEAVRSVGWIELCVLESADVNVMRAQFKGIYNTICERSKERQHNMQAYTALTPSERKQMNPADSFIKELTENRGVKKLEGGAR